MAAVSHACTGSAAAARPGLPAVLGKFDDYPMHQIAAPVAHVATGDRNAYDRYWFNGSPSRGAG